MILLLVAGIVVGAAGFLAVGFGIPIKDTTFGNTIQLAGIVLLCTGLLLAGLALVVRELRSVARVLAQGAARPAARTAGAGRQQSRPMLPPNPLAPAFDQPDEQLIADSAGADQQPGAPTMSPPWAAEAAARERSRTAGGQAASLEPAESVEPPPVPPPPPERPARRNLLFATRRRDRAEQSPADSGPAELPPIAPPVLPPTPALEAEPRASFDSAWPASRGGDAPGRRSRTEPPAPPPPESGSAAAAAPTAAETTAPHSSTAPPGVTVIKSGVVDGMAYSLYSDGSIEAQMPEGMLRFASLDELRAHLEQRP